MPRFSGRHVNDIWTKARLDEVLPPGISRAELILRYTLSHPDCHTTIVGTCDPTHFRENVEAASRGPLPPSWSRKSRSELPARSELYLPRSSRYSGDNDALSAIPCWGLAAGCAECAGCPCS